MSTTEKKEKAVQGENGMENMGPITISKRVAQEGESERRFKEEREIV